MKTDVMPSVFLHSLITFTFVSRVCLERPKQRMKVLRKHFGAFSLNLNDPNSRKMSTEVRCPNQFVSCVTRFKCLDI